MFSGNLFYLAERKPIKPMPFETGGSGSGNGGAISGTDIEETWICLATTTNGQLASNSGLFQTPVPGFIEVTVGIRQIVGNGVKTADCYFSNDGGTTAKQLTSLTVGDKLYWNTIISKVKLATTDRIILHYRI